VFSPGRPYISYCMYSGLSRDNTHNFYRNENYLVLSEALDEKAVQILMDVALLKKLPEQCSMWRKVQTDIREKSREELSRRQGVACQDLDREEHALRVALREAVVTDVVKLFP
jgi:hypothetical protein